MVYTGKADRDHFQVGRSQDHVFAQRGVCDDEDIRVFRPFQLLRFAELFAAEYELMAQRGQRFCKFQNG